MEQLLEAWQATEEDLARFDTLAPRWKQETAHQSNIAKRALHPAYQEIIGMGEKVVPLLLAELRREPDDWFWALHAITGANPVPTESRSDLHAMADAWLRWGLEKVPGMTAAGSNRGHQSGCDISIKRNTAETTFPGSLSLVTREIESWRW